ncbi:MAG TPA: hypothetical protein VGE57_01815 [Solimonas sp.]
MPLMTKSGVRRRVLGAIVGLALLGSSLPTSAAAAAGEVMMLTGRATATDTRLNAVRELGKGDKVNAGEIINSGVNSYLNLKFSDGSFVLLRPGTRFIIEEFVDATAPAATTSAATTPATTAPPARPAAPATAPTGAAASASAASPTGSRAFFRLVRGGFRAVSGLIGKADQNEYRVATPVATIGIRGTDYIVVACDAACAKDPVLRAELPEGAAEGGIVANIVDGSIRLDAQQRRAALSSPVGWLGASLLLTQATEPYPNTVPVDASSITLPSQQGGRTVRNAVIGPDGRIYALGQPPQFLADQPLPDPRTMCP